VHTGRNRENLRKAGKNERDKEAVEVVREVVASSYKSLLVFYCG
jgi:hypothetical protein